MSELWASVGRAEALGQRSSQQDCAAHALLPPLADGPERLLVVLADGMGGHAAGDVASKTAVNAFMAETQQCTGANSAEILQRGLSAAALAVQAKANSDAALKDMGTTLVAGVVEKTTDGDVVVRWVSVGDSPLWRVNEKAEMERLNLDQSLAGELAAELRAGTATPEQAAIDPRRMQSNVLTLALMVAPFDLARADMHLDPLPLASGDLLLFSSDGAESLPEKLIGETIRKKRTAGTAAMTKALVKAVIDRKTPHQDNVMVVLVDPAPSPQKRSLFG